MVTGANTGIGKETALDFAKRGARVIIGCRDAEKANKARDEIIEASGNQNVVVKEVDFLSFKSVRKFAEEILATENRLDILVNNAGVAGFGMKVSEDSICCGTQVNHFSPFLLTNLLLDLMKKSAPSRIVMVSSIVHSFADFDVNKLHLTYKSSWNVYQCGKLANILMANELSRRLKGTGVTVNSLHPGLVHTDIYRKFPSIHKIPIVLFAKYFHKNAFQGAQTSIYLAVSEEVEGVSGKYFENCKELKPSKKALDEDLAKQLWEKSEILVGLKEKSQ